jgi:CMP-2-keto-3-deoxyoctulosonic acid synthetase
MEYSHDESISVDTKNDLDRVIKEMKNDLLIKSYIV